MHSRHFHIDQFSLYIRIIYNIYIYIYIYAHALPHGHRTPCASSTDASRSLSFLLIASSRSFCSASSSRHWSASCECKHIVTSTALGHVLVCQLRCESVCVCVCVCVCVRERERGRESRVSGVNMYVSCVRREGGEWCECVVVHVGGVV